MSNNEKLSYKILIVLGVLFILTAYWLYSGKAFEFMDWLISFGRLVGA